MAAVDPLEMAVVKTLTGVAHADAEPEPKKAARRYSTSLRMQYFNREQGPSVMRRAQLWLMKSAFALRHAASLMGAAQQSLLEGKTEAEVITMYHDALAHEKGAEAEDTKADLSGCAWELAAIAAERDLTFDAQKLACIRFFAAHRISRARVWGVQ